MMQDWTADFAILRQFWAATPPADVQVDLDSPDEGVRLAAVVELVRGGSLTHGRKGAAVMQRLLAMCSSEHPILCENAHVLMGACAPEAVLAHVLESHREGCDEQPTWWKQEGVALALFHSKLLWTVPVIIRLWHRMCMGGWSREADILWIEDLLAYRSASLPKAKGYKTYKGGEHFTIDAWFMLQAWRQVRERIGDDHTPIMFGDLFDPRTFAEAVLRGEFPWPRQIYETTTGANCSNWYKKGTEQPLQIAAEMERFLAEDAHRYQPGRRYCLGQPVPNDRDPRVIDHMNEAIAYLEAQIQAVNRKYLIETGVLEADEEEDDAPGWDHYAYKGIDNWPTDPNGSAWHRVALVAQDAVLGEFHRLVDRVIEAAELEDDSTFDLFAAQLLGDAGPSEQLRRLVTLADERREPRWSELCLIALAHSGLGWALEAAGELACRLDPEAARFGPPWLHIWRRLWPKIDMQRFKLFRSRDAPAVREAIRERTAAHDPDTVLWGGEPLHCPRLLGQLAVAVGKDPQAPAEVAALRHLLQTMTGFDLAAIWASPTEVDPIRARQRIDRLHAEPTLQTHEAGTRLFFGTRVPSR